MQDITSPDLTWTGWPSRPVLTLYGPDGICLERSRSIDFDLADAIGPHYQGDHLIILFGIRSDSDVPKKWTEARLQAQEANIRNDLTADGYEVRLRRLKGPKLACAEEALWRLAITA